MNWEISTVGSVCDVIAGQSPEGINYNKEGNGLPFYQGKKDFGEKFIQAPTVWTTQVTKVAEAGDILMSVRAPVGPVNLATDKICIGRGLAAIRVKKKINKDYLFYFFQKIENELVGSSGAVFNSINKSQISNIEIPLPPLAIQKKIVERLDAIFEEIERATAAAEANVKNAAILEKRLVSKLISNFSEDCFVKFGKVCNFVRGPFGGSLKKSMFVDKGYAVYEQQHPINNQFIDFRYFIDKEKFSQMRRFEVSPCDLIMSCSGTLGKVAVVPNDAPRGVINQALLKITPTDVVRSDYLKLIIESEYFQSILLSVSGGAAQVNVPSLSVIKEFLIPVLSHDEQINFVEKVSFVLSYRFPLVYESKKKSLSTLKDSILKQAFNGELVKE